MKQIEWPIGDDQILRVSGSYVSGMTEFILVTTSVSPHFCAMNLLSDEILSDPDLAASAVVGMVEMLREYSRNVLDGLRDLEQKR